MKYAMRTVYFSLALVVLLTGLAIGRHAIFWSPSDTVQFSSGDIELTGTLVRPGQPGPHPAILMLHGSGPEPRLELPSRAVVNALVDAGFAVLAYDKRGVDESGGDFESATYADFIDDALAAIDFAQRFVPKRV